MQTETLGIGISIHGVDANTATAAEMSTIKDLLYRNRLIVLKDQAVSEQQYCDFANRFGFPVPYLQENYRHPDFPLIFVSSNVKSDGQQIGVPRTGGYWHSDTSFEKEPKVITMLMPKVLPANHPRSTRFVDMAAVYAELPQATKDKLAGAEFLHSGRYRYKIRPDNVGYDIFEILQAIDAFAPPVRHPAVIEHPYTKEKVLYANSGFTIGIADRSLDESAALLQGDFRLRGIRPLRAGGSLVDGRHHHLGQSLPVPHLRPQQRSRGGDDDAPHHPAGRLSALRQPDAGQSRLSPQLEAEVTCHVHRRFTDYRLAPSGRRRRRKLRCEVVLQAGLPGLPLRDASDDRVNLPIAVSPAFIGEILRPIARTAAT